MQKNASIFYFCMRWGDMLHQYPIFKSDSFHNFVPDLIILLNIISTFLMVLITLKYFSCGKCFTRYIPEGCYVYDFPMYAVKQGAANFSPFLFFV